MPYISQTERSKFTEVIKQTSDAARTPGDLNYLITEICHNYMRNKGIRYTNFNEVIGMLECCKLELYRRQVAPYEDTCVVKNGDTTKLFSVDMFSYDVTPISNIPVVDVANEGFANRLTFTYDTTDRV
jgi:hypothetical protein